MSEDKDHTGMAEICALSRYGVNRKTADRFSLHSSKVARVLTIRSSDLCRLHLIP
ncbi:hypothetical protein MAR_016133, partial [Mya arenaria]